MKVKIIIDVKAPILKSVDVLKIPLVKLIAFKSSAPLFCLILTIAITAMVKMAVNPI